MIKGNIMNHLTIDWKAYEIIQNKLIAILVDRYGIDPLAYELIYCKETRNHDYTVIYSHLKSKAQIKTRIQFSDETVIYFSAELV